MVVKVIIKIITQIVSCKYPSELTTHVVMMRDYY